MKSLVLKDLGKHGVNFDVAPSLLPAEVFSSGNNFKLSNGVIKTFNGQKLEDSYFDSLELTWASVTHTWESINLTWEDFGEVYPGYIQYVVALSGTYYLIMCHDRAFAVDGNSWHSITSARGYRGLNPGDEGHWTGCTIGGTPVVTNPQHFPEYWAPAATAQILRPLEFSPGLTWAGAEKSARIIRSHGSFLIALNLIEAGIEEPSSYRWSHPADINSLPHTWDETDLSALAGKASIEGSGGALVDGLSLRDSFVLYAERSISILDYTGDNFVWRRRELTNSYGLLSKHCVVEVLGKHYFMTESDIMVTDGNSVESLLYGRAKTLLAKLNKSEVNNCFVAADYAKKEVWFFFAEEGFVYPNTALVYNWEENLLYKRDVSNNICSVTNGALIGPSATWENIDYTWANVSHTWNNINPALFGLVLVGLSKDQAKIYSFTENELNENLSSYVEKLSFSIENLATLVTITRITLDIDCRMAVRVMVGTQTHLGAKIQWGTKLHYDPNNKRKLDLRSTGRYHSWRIESRCDHPFKLKGMTIEYVTRGVR